MASIEAALRDYGTSDDAMRWTPEPLPARQRPAPSPPTPPRVEQVEITVRMSDGTAQHVVVQQPQDVVLSMAPEREEEQWGDLLYSVIIRPPRARELTMTMRYPLSYEVRL